MIHKSSTLSLNGNWFPIGFKTGAEAIATMMSGDKNNPPALGVSLDYAIGEDGKVDFDMVTNISTHPWEEWKNLPVRPHDFGVGTIKGIIRIPTVIFHPNFRRQIKKKKRYTKTNVSVYRSNFDSCYGYY